MSRIRVAPIVEGHGEVESVRKLLERTWCEVLGGEYLESVKPTRHPRGTLKKQDGLQRAVTQAIRKLGLLPRISDPNLVLVLIDADDDCPAVLAPQLLGWVRQVDPRFDMSCVVVNVNYETWFVAAADSLTGFLGLREGEEIPDDVEGQRLRAAWVERHFIKSLRYRKTVDQPRMTAAMDLALCRRRAPSFDKLCRELERRLTGAPA